MRLVAWNANYNNKRRTLEENVEFLRPLRADILVLSETSGPTVSNPLGAHWFGNGGPGLAVIAPTGLELIPHPANATAPKLMGAFSVRRHVAFELLAVWPVKLITGPSYHQVLMSALDRYAELWRTNRAIMAGDFNSNTRVSKQKQTHPRFVKLADSFGLVSAYHEQSGEQHGEESVATYLHGSGGKEFHIDYCFVSKSLRGSFELNVTNDAEWKQQSDHFPLILDVHDKALTA